MFERYEVFEDGTIVNLFTGNEMSQTIKGKSREVRLQVDGVRKNFIVSRLVYWLFNPDFDISDRNLCIVADDLINFTLDDLKVVHRKDLIQGEKHCNQAKLSDAQVEAIRKAYNGKPCTNQHDKSGVSYADLANQYGVTKALIAQIVRGEVRNEENYYFKNL